METPNTFAARMRQRYPEGLTGIAAIGGTRTTYVLEHNRQRSDPGQIQNLWIYADYMLDSYLNFARMFFELGGQNLIMGVLAFQRFHDRGEEYAEFTAQATSQLAGDKAQAFYRDNEIDPYFIGIDTLLHLPEDQLPHRLAADLTAFQKNWQYQPGRRKLLWEIAPIPLYSFWRAAVTMGQEAQAALDAALAATTHLQEIHRLTYQFYSRAIYGTDLPIPHFYLGTNRKGDLKLRVMAPISLLCGGPFRMFYTPYPSLFTTRETLQAILEDLAFGTSLDPFKKDYSGQYTSEMIEAEYQRVVDLRDDPLSTVGLLRHIAMPDDA